MYRYKYKPSKSKAIEFSNLMRTIDEFCEANGIVSSRTNDSYYFEIGGQKYRVSNHSIEASNSRAYDDFGFQIRDKYHADSRDEETIYIHASKTRIMDIYNDLKNGFLLDGRGNRK